NWGNWRTVPRCMSGLVPDRPLMIVDLGCGSGGSTRILAFYAPRGSRILAYELARPLINVARDRLYLHADGQPLEVEFLCQGITETLRGPDGGPLPDHSVDLANSSGVVGHHLDTRSLRTLAVELRRMLKHDGLAMLDSGRSLTAADVIGVMQTEGFTPLRQRKSHWLDPYGQVVFQRSAER
ncbi:MAG: class I SAM-dependent methyltransferase, partial [Planctomycetaceae bacterium]